MDRSKLHIAATIDMEITEPSGAPSGMTVTLRGMDSPEAKRILKKYDKIRNRRRGTDLDFDQKEAASIELLEAVTVDWQGYEDAGASIDCTPEERHDLYTNPATRFIRQQIDEKLGDVSSFLTIDGDG